LPTAPADDFPVPLLGQFVTDVGGDAGQVAGADGYAGQAEGEGGVGERRQPSGGLSDQLQDGRAVAVVVQA
jgi:hypothetical protein